MTFVNVEFEPKKAPRETWDQYHVYRRIIQQESRPDDPILPDDVVETRMKMDDPFSEQRQFLAIADGRIAGHVGWGVMKPEAPGYESNKNYIWGGGSVIGEARRRGIGRSWLQLLLQAMKEWDKTLMTVWGVELDDGIAFMDWLGAEVKTRFKENRLDFRKIDWRMIERWISEGKEKNSDMQTTLFENKLPEDFYEEYSPILSQLLMTMPFDDLEHGDIVITPEVLAEDQKKRDELKTEHHTFVVRAPDGRLAAMTDVQWNPNRPTYITQLFTGVDPDFRGRGLGKLVKAAMVDFIKTKYDDIHWIVTGNANSNDPMLAINNKMGFFLFKQSLTYQMRREFLGARLTEISKELP